jgi:hypothetical protein
MMQVIVPNIVSIRDNIAFVRHWVVPRVPASAGPYRVTSSGPLEGLGPGLGSGHVDAAAGDVPQGRVERALYALRLVSGRLVRRVLILACYRNNLNKYLIL